jgi:beta-N-acetylhexosaminidase
MSASEVLSRAISTTLLPGFVGTSLPEWLDLRLRSGLGGVCIFGSNITSLTQLRALTDAISAANPDALIAIDEEGGDVTRLYYASGSPYPGNAVLGRIDDLAYTESVARSVGWQLRAVGCNLNFAPDVDINSNPDNPVIGVRSFGSTADLVAAHSAAWTRGLQSTGVAASAKHFPGHGDTAQDSHLALPVVDRSLDQLREQELVPFAAVIAAGAKTIMTSHILLPQLDAENPATHSRSILSDLLRGELGFDGLIVSDALDMKGASGAVGIPEAAVRALSAGCDLLCIGTENTDEQLSEIEQAIQDAINDARLDGSRIEDAAARVVKVATQLRDERARIPESDATSTDTGTAEPERDLELDRIIAAFDVQPEALSIITEASGNYQIVKIDTVANIAIGDAPWGLFAELEANPHTDVARLLGAHPVAVVSAAHSPELIVGAATPIIVIGKDNHRHGFAREAIDRLRSTHSAVVVVDMGWASDDRAYADIATFGASRLVGRALGAYLIGQRR